VGGIGGRKPISERECAIPPSTVRCEPIRV
jgi:hypothetical protein